MLITSLILVFWIGRACREGGVIKSLVFLTGDGGVIKKPCTSILVTVLYFYFSGFD